MARAVDEGKIERIREATIGLVVERGYGGASISAIAHRANVAEGYLYRFYPGKQALVTELLFSKVAQIIEKLEFLLNSCTSIKEVFSQLVYELFQMASDAPETIKFIYVLMHDYNFQVSDDQRMQIKRLVDMVIKTGKETGEVNRNTLSEEAYAMVFIYPIEYINLKMKGFFGSIDWSLQEQRRVAEFSINALK